MVTPTVDAIPIFERNFDRFLTFLSDDASPTSISPTRFGQVLSLDMQTLAGESTRPSQYDPLGALRRERTRHLRESVRVTRAAVDIAGSIEKAIFWFKNNPLPTFDYKTPQDLVSEGRTEIFIFFLSQLASSPCPETLRSISPALSTNPMSNLGV